MSTESQFNEALVTAAQKVLKKTLSQADKTRLFALFNAESGTTFDRAEEAIRKIGDLTERQLIEKSAASDDTNRAMKDLKNIANQWKK